MAAAVCILARDRQGPKLAFELLYYPVAGASRDLPSMVEFGPGCEGVLDNSDHAKLIDTCAMRAVPADSSFGAWHRPACNLSRAARHASRGAHAARRYKPVLEDTRYAVIRADLKGLPPALVITCEVDPVRDEGRAYAEKLQVMPTCACHPIRIPLSLLELPCWQHHACP